MTELFLFLAIMGSVLGLCCFAFSLVYAFGGKKIREDIRKEFEK